MTASIETTLRKELERVQAQLRERQEELRPLEEEEKKLERMLREYTSGSLGSGDITDDQIVTWVRKNAHEGDRRSTSEIARAFDSDGRGFSKRLPRMVRDGLLAGDPQGGYYVAMRTSRAKQKVA